ILLSLVSCEIDNYDAPQLTISGKILDSELNELVGSSGINAGTVVRLYEDNSTQPLIYNTLPEGTFINSKVFAGNYSYIAEGPFTMVGESSQNLIIDRDLEFEIKVIPNVRLGIALDELTGTTAKVILQYEKVAAEQELVNLSVIWSEFRNPNVYTFSGGGIIQEDVSSLNLTSGEKQFIIEDLKPNTKYYIRGSGVTNNPGNYYNYSSQIEIQTQ
ncbi:MAG: hypothetical protein WD426_19850, partial [Anditalea sp.]